MHQIYLQIYTCLASVLANTLRAHWRGGGGGQHAGGAEAKGKAAEAATAAGQTMAAVKGKAAEAAAVAGATAASNE